MVEGFVGTHDLFKVKIGDELGTREFVVTEEMVERNAWANDNYNPWYMEDSPFSGRIVSPTFLSSYDAKVFYGYLTRWVDIMRLMIRHYLMLNFEVASVTHL